MNHDPVSMGFGTLGSTGPGVYGDANCLITCNSGLLHGSALEKCLLHTQWQSLMPNAMALMHSSLFVASLGNQCGQTSVGFLV